MSDSIRFTPAAGKKIVKAVKIVLGESLSQTGSPSKKNSLNTREFWGLITDHDTSTPIKYSWKEYVDSGGGALIEKPGGRMGTPAGPIVGDMGPAYNLAQNAGGLVGGFVRLKLGFDSSGNPSVEFHGGAGSQEDVLTLPNGTFGAPDSTTWSRETDLKAVIYDAFIFGYDSGSDTWWWHSRTPTYDARGMLASVTAATEHTIETTACS